MWFTSLRRSFPLQCTFPPRLFTITVTVTRNCILHHDSFTLPIILFFPFFHVRSSLYFMGNKLSAVHGVKSDDFYRQGNAINEIWIGDAELVSRLPFGDSDLGQAGWPSGSWPKIPWHQFIIPLKRDLQTFNTTAMSNDSSQCFWPTEDFLSLPGFLDFNFHKEWHVGVCYFLGGTLFPLGLYMLSVYIKDSEIIQTQMRLYQQTRLRIDPVEWIPAQIKLFFWAAMRMRAGFFLLGVALLWLGVPLLVRGLQGMPAPSFFLCLYIMAMLWIIPYTMFQVGNLFWQYRRAMATHSPEARQQSEPGTVVLTVEELKDFEQFIHAYARSKSAGI